MKARSSRWLVAALAVSSVGVGMTACLPSTRPVVEDAVSAKSGRWVLIAHAENRRRYPATFGTSPTVRWSQLETWRDVSGGCVVVATAGEGGPSLAVVPAHFCTPEGQ
jgi:hypothetical protein